VLKAPFPYFGGKSRAAAQIWARLGDPDNYVEPFFGSGAVLLARPGGHGKVETVNDADGLLSNFWRAVRADPASVAAYADWPVNEADLHARHLWLVGRRESLTDRLMADPDWCDVKAAGWWVWGACCWIGGGWCVGKGPWVNENGRFVRRGQGQGVPRQRPHLSDAGHGVHRVPRLSNAGHGVHRKRPHLGDAGHGVHRVPCLENEPVDRLSFLTGWFESLSKRLARVRVCCGDWSRVCGPCVTTKHGVTGVFLDPPYAHDVGRCKGLYASDCNETSAQVQQWCLEHGHDPSLRIALCGYEGEHDLLERAGWTVMAWKAQGGYSTTGKGEENTNRFRERVWFSPHCLPAGLDSVDGTLSL
jgi:hypothetical protein